MLERLKPAIGNEGTHRPRKQRAYIVIHMQKKGEKYKNNKKESGGGRTTRWLAKLAAEDGTCDGSDLQCEYPGCEREE